jgi:hypothetical protein
MTLNHRASVKQCSPPKHSKIFSSLQFKLWCSVAAVTQCHYHICNNNESETSLGKLYDVQNRIRYLTFSDQTYYDIALLKLNMKVVFLLKS